ncbi:MAG TPA: hypothetical protein VLQ92_13055, partial [Candidatus Limnocylindrales bacterium]|nr:hypothetical protein [Candidatus Limnocylindrales bacterium]
MCELETIERQVEHLTGGARDPGSQTDPWSRTEHARRQPPPGDLGEALLRLGRVVERLGAVRALWAEQ